MDLRVRSARLDDLRGLTALWRELDGLHARVAPGFFRAPPPAEHFEAWLPPELSPRALAAVSGSSSELLLVAEDAGGELLGALAGGVRDTPRSASMRPRRRLHVETLVVSPAARRRGAGRALMAQAEAWARQRGAEQVVLTVWQGNDEAAGFYQAMGYGTVSRVLARDL